MLCKRTMDSGPGPVMRELGLRALPWASYDRGARVAQRMGLDTEASSKRAVLTMSQTGRPRTADKDFGLGIALVLLAQQEAPLHENQIGAGPGRWVRGG